MKEVRSISAGRGRAAGAAVAIAVLGLAVLSCAVFPNLGVDRKATSTEEARLVQEWLQLTREAGWVEQTAEAATEIAGVATATFEAQQRATATAAARATAEAQATQQAIALATQQEGMARTQQAAGLYAEAQRLAQAGLLPGYQGVYHGLPDFEKNVAKINYTTWWRTSLTPKTFVVRADVAYESASATANWFNAGCGFVFWDNGPNDHYRVLVALDGNVYADAFRAGQYLPLGKTYYGQPAVPKGSFKLELVVNPQSFYVFVNGTQVKKVDAVVRSKEEGNFSFTLASGTNKDFGTRCTFTNAELYEVK